MLCKQLGDVHEQAEQTSVELETFRRLQQLEEHAIPRRMEVRAYWRRTYMYCTCYTVSSPIQWNL